MVIVSFNPSFEKTIHKIYDNLLKEKIKKQIAKLIKNPEIGKPMRFGRKGTREVYIPPFRLCHSYVTGEDKIIMLELYHKDKQ